MCGRACGAAMSGCGCQGSALMGLGEAPAQSGGFPFMLTALLGVGLVVGLTVAVAR